MRRHKPRTLRTRRPLDAIAYAFRERQIYLRAEGEVQFITLKPWVQAAGLASLLAGLFWVAFSSINVAFKDQLLALRERGMYDARLEYEDRIAAMRNEVDRLNDQLMIDQTEYLERVDQVKADFDRLLERHKRLVEFFRQATARKAAGETPPALLEPLPNPTDEMPADSHGGQSGLAPNPMKGNLAAESFSLRYAAAFRNPLEALQPLADLNRLFADYEKMELTLLDDALEIVQNRSSKARDIFQKLGIDDQRVVANSDYQPAEIGGPLITVSLEEPRVDVVSKKLGEVLDTYDAYAKMKHEAQGLPVQMPLKNTLKVTSGYGIRRDPFRHTIAMHAGVDFKSEVNSPVYATAEGKISAAGWEGAYGRMVEILHDNGVATRYAHLSSIAVAVGEKVKRGDMVGRLGNTGRSTGPHLHYETRVRGRAVDPVRFWQTSYAIQELSKEE
ncbi:MAG TPA: M23 family metallopeptidase [Aestuariivirgaceae bacterium]|jgi:murein DD-endopeptidase MepM/ murein hydrolase activator NlpD